jgi:hypothetical protein
MAERKILVESNGIRITEQANPEQNLQLGNPKTLMMWRKSWIGALFGHPWVYCFTYKPIKNMSFAEVENEMRLKTLWKTRGYKDGE